MVQSAAGHWASSPRILTIETSRKWFTLFCLWLHEGGVIIDATMSRGKLSVSSARSDQKKGYIPYRSPSEYNREFDGCGFYLNVQIPFDFTINRPWNDILTDATYVGIQGIHINLLCFQEHVKLKFCDVSVMEGAGDHTHSRHSMSVWQTHRSVCYMSPQGPMRESLSSIIHKLGWEALQFGTCA